ATHAGEPDRARSLAELLEREAETLSPDERVHARARAARTAFLAGDREHAHALANSAFVAAGAFDRRALRDLAMAFARARQSELAVRCLADEEDVRWQALYWASAARELAEAGEGAAALDLAGGALDAADASGGDTFMVSWIRREAVVAMAKAGRCDLALQQAHRLHDGSERAAALAGIPRPFVAAHRPGTTR